MRGLSVSHGELCALKQPKSNGLLGSMCVAYLLTYLLTYLLIQLNQILEKAVQLPYATITKSQTPSIAQRATSDVTYKC